MDSNRYSFSSLSDLSQMFTAPDHINDAPPTISPLFDDRRHQGVGIAGVPNKERERRGKMAITYSILHSYLPNLASNKQASREKIVTEAIALIKRLEADKSRLEQQLLINRNVAKVASSSSVAGDVRFSRDAVAFEIKLRGKSMNTTKMMISLSDVFEKFGAEILTISVVVADDEGLTATIAVTAAIVDVERTDVVVEGIKRELLNLDSQNESHACIKKMKTF